MPNLFRSFGLHPNKDKLKDSVTAYHKSKQSDGAIRSRKIRFVFRLLTFKAPVDSFGFVGVFFSVESKLFLIIHIEDEP